MRENDVLKRRNDVRTEENVMLFERIVQNEMIIQALRVEVEKTSAAPKQGENTDEGSGLRRGMETEIVNNALTNIGGFYDNESGSTEATDIMDEETVEENVDKNNATEEPVLTEPEDN